MQPSGLSIPDLDACGSSDEDEDLLLSFQTLNLRPRAVSSGSHDGPRSGFEGLIAPKQKAGSEMSEMDTKFTISPIPIVENRARYNWGISEPYGLRFEGNVTKTNPACDCFSHPPCPDYTQHYPNAKRTRTTPPKDQMRHGKFATPVSVSRSNSESELSTTPNKCPSPLDMRGDCIIPRGGAGGVQNTPPGEKLDHTDPPTFQLSKFVEGCGLNKVSTKVTDIQECGCTDDSHTTIGLDDSHTTLGTPTPVRRQVSLESVNDKDNWDIFSPDLIPPAPQTASEL